MCCLNILNKERTKDRKKQQEAIIDNDNNKISSTYEYQINTRIAFLHTDLE